jgi:hypothetical protein
MQRPKIALASTLPTLLLSAVVQAAPVGPGSKISDTYQITLTRHSTEQGTDGSSGSSDDRDVLIERVIGVRVDGQELEYDFPKDTPKAEKDSSWQLPARVFRPFDGPIQLLDRAAVEKRVGAWLKAANWPRSICGHWIFTWNAFQIECGPESVLKMVQAFEFETDVREGARYTEPHAREPAILANKTVGPEGGEFAADMEIDPETVRREQAQSDVVVGELMNKPVSFDAALNKHAADAISGTISVTFDTDAQGNVWRRTKITKLEIKEADGKAESKTVTETLERRPVPRG